MSGIWTITVPEVGTNQVLNPSGELAANFAAHNGATVTRDTTFARFGDYSYKIVPGAVNRGINLTLAALANAIHNVTFYVNGTITGTLQVSLDSGANYNPAAIVGGRTGGWVRYQVQISAAQANGSTACIIRNTANETFYVDAVQVEATSGYYTTYIDGDRATPDLVGGYRWSGLRHGSSSMRSAQERRGGRERNLLDDYSVEVVEGTRRIGMPPVIHSLQSQSLLPGALYQGVKVLPREIELNLNYSSTTWAGFHGKRNDVIDLLKPDLVRGSQPIVIGYAGPGTAQKVYAEFYYAGGLELGDFLAYDETAAVRLLAPDPFWMADDQETAALDYQDSVASAAYALRRHDGQWKALGTGFNDLVQCIAIDKQRNRIFFGGRFTTANGVTVNGICYWNGTTFVAMGGVTKGVGVAGTAIVYQIVVMPNGDVYVLGNMTTAGGSATKGIARWNNSTDTWTQFSPASTSGNTWFAGAVDTNGLLYVGGNWVGWNGTAGEDYIASFDGTTWTKLGTSPFNSNNFPSLSYSIAVDKDNKAVVGSVGTVGTSGILTRWDGSTWTTLGSTQANESIAAVLVLPDNTYVVGGQFTVIGGVTAANVARYMGSNFVALGSGVNTTVYCFTRNSKGIIVASGVFTSAGGIALADRIALWNGYTWTHLDCDLPGSPSVFACQFNINDDLYLAFNTTGTATAAGLTTVTLSGSTAAYPRLSIINDNSSGTCTLQWFENQSSDHHMYFNLVVQAGEKVELDLANSQKRLMSDWRGQITDNPLKNSDVTNWKLQPGANTIAAFITGTVTTVTALLHWTPKYWSADGAA